MLVWTDVAGDARVLREAVTLAESGHTVHVIGRDVPDGFVPPSGVTVSSVVSGRGLRPSGRRHRLTAPQRLARWLLLPEHVSLALRTWTTGARRDAAARSYDIVHAHDYSTLALGAELADASGAKLVYDSHEVWFGRPRVGRPTPLRRLVGRFRERRLGARADVVITVGEGVAGVLRERYGWPRVFVVRNTFPLADDWGVGPSAAPHEPRRAVYAGRIGPHRELETVVSAARLLSPFPVTVAGPADATYLAGFDSGPVEVRGTLTLPEVDKLLRSAGLALVTLSATAVNHQLALPNKLFHAVRAGVPVVAADLPELRRIVTRYGLGVMYRPGDSASLAAAVRRVRERYPELCAAVRAAAPALSWEADAAVLRKVYALLDHTAAVRKVP
jgi:glycosyltransferase involved in cell wall biosynthesis